MYDVSSKPDSYRTWHFYTVSSRGFRDHDFQDPRSSWISWARCALQKQQAEAACTVPTLCPCWWHLLQLECGRLTRGSLHHAESVPLLVALLQLRCGRADQGQSAVCRTCDLAGGSSAATCGRADQRAGAMQCDLQTSHNPCTASLQEATLTLQAADLTRERDRLEKQLNQAKAAAQATADQQWKLTRQAEVRQPYRQHAKYDI